MKYYTDKEMIAEMAALMEQGKPVTDIVKDPRCKPDFKKKIEHLKGFTTKKKGGRDAN